MINYNLRKLNEVAKIHQFNRDTLEKVLRLAELLKLFNENDELKGYYVLKGGTAINLCLFDFPRLSVDIDLNFNDDCSKEDMLETRKHHKKIIQAYVSQDGYTVDGKSRFSFTLDSYLLKYTNAVGNQDNIKVEINYSNRIQILNPRKYLINSKIVDNETALSLDRVELYGSKIAALIGRTTVRDVYDVFKMITNKIIKDHELAMLKKCSIFYLLTSNEYQPIEELLGQFRLNLDNISYGIIQKNLIPLLHVGEKIELDIIKQTVLDYINKLFLLTYSEKKYIESYNAGEYCPELLFDSQIVNRIKQHPMVLWKMQKQNENN
ncbi:MAG: nucleotidyl transferase AbiEii/AbiGii toxin family protein [Candidatus Izemoplasmatales bacterium]